jgi:hypothetical protein
MYESIEGYSVDSYEFRGTKYLGRNTYTIRFRGNTAVRIEPALIRGYATYARAYSFGGKVPRVAVLGFVPSKRIDW